MGLKIAIAVHGRFHAFDLARELLRRGHEVVLFTNYPKFAVARFGVPPKYVRSLVLHGVVSRILHRLRNSAVCSYPEAWLHSWFGRWAAAGVEEKQWDAVVCWSGIGEETFRALSGSRTVRICHRSSSHIRKQARLLEEEENRVGIFQERPSPWIISREEREYALADVIYVPSSFVKGTFLTEGVLPEKLILIPHGVDTKAFRPPAEAIEARCRRILSGEPLQVLNIGTFSYRKGMRDLAEVIRRLHRGNFRFGFVGPIAPEAAILASEMSQLVTFTPKQSQETLPARYEWGDIFILPTIEDGFPFVLAQAAAAGLPILTTANGAGTDLVREGETGWVLPIRSPDAFAERLQWCDRHRKELVGMVRRIYNEYRPRDWSNVAADFESYCRAFLNNHKGKVS